jgi:D-alanyl-D-alanine dipeptidase
MRYLIVGLASIAWLACGESREVKSAKAPEESGYNFVIGDSVGADSFQGDTVPKIGELEQRLIDAGLVNIQQVIPEVLVDLRYAGTNNFFGKNVYGALENCYLQPEVAEMLKNAHYALKEKNPSLTFLIFDGVRPQSVQQILWDELDKPDSIKPLYVANPQRGSLHNFGVAVDLTIADGASATPLDMGTDFDYFGYPAYPDREEQMLREGEISRGQVNNRQLLREVMNNAGFIGIGSEWWHFNAFSRKVAGEKFDIVK